MAVKRKSFKESLRAKDMEYCNDFFELKNTPQVFTDSFSYNDYEITIDKTIITPNNSTIVKPFFFFILPPLLF